MFWPLIQISPIWPSGSSVAVSESTMVAHSATPILPARRLRDGARRVGRDLDEAAFVQLVAVDVDDLGRLAHRRGRHEQRRLGQAVGRLDRLLLEAVRARTPR